MSYSPYGSHRPIDVLVGKTIESIKEAGGTSLTFKTTDGLEYHMEHMQSCCEDVSLEDVAGDLNDLIGSPVLTAYEESDTSLPPRNTGYTSDSYTWTFYRLSTIKGTVTLRWYGTSNGYYGEDVDFMLVKGEDGFQHV